MCETVRGNCQTSITATRFSDVASLSDDLQSSGAEQAEAKGAGDDAGTECDPIMV